MELDLSRRKFFKYAAGAVGAMVGLGMESPFAPPSKRVSTRLKATEKVIALIDQSNGSELSYKVAGLWMWCAAVADSSWLYGYEILPQLMEEYLYSEDSSVRDLTRAVANKIDVPATLNNTVDCTVATGDAFVSKPYALHDNYRNDLYLSLGSSTYQIGFDNIRINGNKISLSNPQVQLRDIYDYGGPNTKNSQKFVDLLSLYLPDCWPSFVKCRMQEIAHYVDQHTIMKDTVVADFALLPKFGLATEFPIQADLHCPNPMEINVNIT